MHKFLRQLLTAACAVIVSASAFAAQPEAVAGKVRVKLQPSVAKSVGSAPRKAKKAGTLVTEVSPLDASLKQIKGISIRPLFPPNPKYAAERAKYGIDQWYEITFDEQVSPAEAKQLLKATAGVQRADLVMPLKLTDSDKFIPFDAKKVPARVTSSALPFNDSRLGAQWHYHNDGSINNAVPGADINLFDAWKIQTGDPSVIVAIIDGGIDVSHEDLSRNMFVNEAEANGLPGVDDDGNGYIDDVYGFNFCTNNATIYPHNHGTHVAGTVAAVNNNGLGVCGVAGGDGSAGSGVRMLSCQVFDSRSGSGEGNFAAALVYAAEMGATIANCSWGWDADGYYEQSVLDAINYFNNMARGSNMTGGLCIFASGNSGATGMFYPGCLDSVLTVAAMTPAKTVASYSNYGSWVDVTAPGGLLDYGEAWGVLSTLPNNSYGWNEGTSMAAPHVTGIAALLLSQYKDTNFSPDMVRRQIESSVNDLYSYNAGMEGLYGSGYVDAAKALQFDTEGTAPAAITDFSLLPAQDNITVEWVIPEATYNTVDHCVLYYSAEAFDASTVDKAKTVNVDTKFLESGATATYEVKALAPLTTYYFAIQAVSSQGNASEISPVKSATTNAGPKMTVSANSLDISDGPATFEIGNEDAGLLKWSYRTRTASFYASTHAVAKTPIAAYSGNLGGAKAKAPGAITTADYLTSDYPKNIKYYEYLWAYIGDTDTSIPNSMAQMFHVDEAKYPDGFNLTTVSVEGAYGENGYIEIYRGGSAPIAANRILAYTPAPFIYSYPLALPEQIFFEAGEDFWIVVHFPAQDNKYPLAIAEATVDGSAAENALMSNDLGKSWVRLSDALRGSSYASMSRPTWTITARSTNPDWSKVLTLTPASGSVRQGEQQEVSVSTDGQPLVNGSYKFNLYFDTNESEKNSIQLPVTLNVSGQKADMKFGKIVEFGSLLVGQSKTVTVEVFNAGYGNFSGSQWGSGLYSDKISSTDENFSGPEYLQSGFPARTSTRFDVTFTPKTAGSHTGEIVFTDKDGVRFSVMVTGVASNPAKLSVEPASVDAGDLEVGGDSKEVSFTISNAGNYPLHFVMPKYSDETVEGASAADVHKFGYTWTSNLNGSEGFAYDGNPALVNAVDITSQFNDQSWWSRAIDPGFRFPYYGKEYTEVYVTSYGAIALHPYEGNMNYPPAYPGHSYLAGGGWMSAFGNNLRIGPDSKIEYAKVDGKFVVKFTDMLAVVYDTDFIPVSFHIALCSNGDVEIYYDSYSAESVFQGGRNLYCGIDDPENSDPLTVTSSEISNPEWASDDELTEEGYRYSYFCDGTAVRFAAPAPNIIVSISPTDGLIAAGQQVEVKAVVKASEDMNAGATVTNLVINSNDLVSPATLVPITANITGDLNPEFVVDNTEIDFGNVFRTADALAYVTVRNNGHADLQITGVEITEGIFTTSQQVPFTIEAGRAKDIAVIMPTDTEGSFTGKISVTSDAGSAVIDIKGSVIGCPEATLGYTELHVETDAGTVVPKPLSITNSGNETLLYSVTAGEHLNYLPDFDNARGTSYSYNAHVDDSSVSTDWIDITTNGLGTQNGLTYFLNHDYVTVDLPFDFQFYGKKYNKMYVYNSGFVSFTERTDEHIWPEPPADFPEGSIFTNIIAPFWGLHSMDETRTAGIFHYVTDNQAVISFMEYGNSMNIGVDFQLVLNADGSFRFVYKADENVPEAQLFSPFGLAGICNEDGSSSIRLSERHIVFGNAVNFSPVVEFALEPGQSAEADINVDARVMGGQYTSAINVSTNVPGAEKTVIPVTINVLGSPVAVFPEEEISVERTAGQQSLDFSDPMVQMGAMYSLYFDVANSGTAPFYIQNIHYSGPMGEDSGWGAEPSFYLFYYGDEYDWSGEPTGAKAWQQYPLEQGEYGLPLEVADAPVKFALPLLPYGVEYMTPGEYEITLTFDLTGIADDVVTKSVNLKYIITPAPAAYSENFEGVHIQDVAPDWKGSADITVTNYGEGTLKGTAYIDLSGVGEEIGGGEGGIDPMKFVASAKEASAALKASAPTFDIVPCDVAESSDDIFDAPDDISFLRAIFHPHAPAATAVYNYGSGTTYSTFKSAVSYVAPEDGFNLSHVYSIIKLGTAQNADYRVDIVSGNNPDGTVLASGTYHSGEDHDALASYQIAIPLDKSVYIAGGQEFCIVLTYPVGEMWPATLVSKQEKVVSKRYQAWTETMGWFDVADLFQSQYGSLGWVITGLETSKGSAWVELDGNGEFTVAPGEATALKLNFNAETAPLEKGNTAMLVFKSNDPNLPLLNIPVVLDKNGKPVIETEAAEVLVPEAAESSFVFTVTEPEGDDMVIRLADSGTLAKITEITGAEASKSADDSDVWSVTAPQGPVTVKVTLAPDYGDAGVYSATLTASDALTNEASSSVKYTVAHTNRAPVAVETVPYEVTVGTSTEVIDFAALFTEPDGEAMTYTVTVADPTIVEPYTSSASAIFVGKKLGTTTVDVTATDEAGESTVNTLTVKVVEAAGIDDVTVAASLRVWPNPVVETLHVTVDSTSEVCLSLTSADGRKVLSVTESADINVHNLDVTSLPAGVYVLTVETDGARPASYLIVKQ